MWVTLEEIDVGLKSGLGKSLLGLGCTVLTRNLGDVREKGAC